MSMNMQIDLSKVCGRKLSDNEAARIREVASNLELREDDALWQLLAAIEYQRVYYEKVPDKIAAVTTDIIKGIGEAAENEVKNAQAKLAQSVVDEARGMARAIQWGSVLPLLITAIITSMFFAGLTMWAGYQLGAHEIRPILEILKMPVGICIGAMLISMPFLYMVIIFFIKKDNKNNVLLEILCSTLLIFIGYIILACSGGVPDSVNIYEIINI